MYVGRRYLKKSDTFYFYSLSLRSAIYIVVSVKMSTASNDDRIAIVSRDEESNQNESRTSQESEEISKELFDAKIESSETKLSFDIKILANEKTLSEIVSTKKDLLSHPIVEAFLLAKWNSVRNWYYGIGIYYLLFLCNLTFLLYLNQFDIKGELKIKELLTQDLALPL